MSDIELKKLIEEMQMRQVQLENEIDALRNNQKFLHEVIDKAGDPMLLVKH